MVVLFRVCSAEGGGCCEALERPVRLMPRGEPSSFSKADGRSPKLYEGHAYAERDSHFSGRQACSRLEDLVHNRRLDLVPS